MGLDIYGDPISGPYRAALMTLEASGASYNVKLLDLRNGDQMKPEFLKVVSQSSINFRMT